MTDKDLRDALLSREGQNGIRSVQTAEALYLGPELPGEVQILLQGRSILLRDRGLVHIHDVEFGLEPVRVATPAFQHCGSVGSRGDADQNALLHSPGLIHPMRSQVRLQLTVNHPSRHCEPNCFRGRCDARWPE